MHQAVIRNIRLPAWNGFQLVQGAAGVAEAATGQLWDSHAVGGHQWAQRQRDLVTDTPCGVLVRGGLAQRCEAHGLARVNHRLSPIHNLAAVHAADEDGHVQRRHLLIAHDAASVGVNDPSNLFRTELTAITLYLDDVNYIELFSHCSLLL